MKPIRVLPLLFSLIIFATFSSHGAVIVWTNVLGGVWTAATNWNPNQVPGALDDVVITNSGTYTVTLGTSATNSSLTLGGSSGTQTLATSSTFFMLNGASVVGTNGVLTQTAGTHGGSGAFTINGTYNWNGGTVNRSSATTIAVGGILTMSGGATKTLNGATLVNAGNATWSAGQLNTGQGSLLSNAPSGTFTITFDSTTGSLGGSRTVANAGQFNVAAGSGNTTTFNDVFNNSGTVNIQSGTFRLNGGGTNSATSIHSVSANTTLDFGGGIHNFNPTASISGAGNFLVSGATANLNCSFNVGGTNTFDAGTANFTGNYTINGTPVIISGGTATFAPGGTIIPSSLSISSGTLGCSNLVTVSGPLSWSGGNIQGNNTMRANGGLTMNGTTKGLNGATLVNTGSATWSAGQLNTGQGSLLSNAPSGTFTITFDSTTGSLGGSRTVANAGQFNVAAGSGNTATFIDVFNNSGTINIQSGTFSLNGGGTNSATSIHSVAANTTLDLGGGIHNFNPAASISGAGNFLIGAGTANLACLFNIGGTNTFDGGTANFTGNYTINGNPVIFSGGTANFAPGGTIAPGSLTISSGNLGCSNLVTVSGPLSWSGGNIEGNNTVRANGGLTMNGAVKGLSGATLVNTGSATWSAGQLNTGQGSLLSNAPSGTFTITFGAANGSLGGSRTTANAGQFNVAAGSGNAASVGDIFNNSGTVNIQSGALTINASAGYIQTSGLTLLNGGNITNLVPLRIQGGILAGSGFISGNVTNSGTVNPGVSPGQLVINGTYTQTTNGTLGIELAGVQPGTGYDQLVVGGTANLAGTLSATLTNGFYPVPGFVFTNVVRASIRNGTFASFNYLSNVIGLQTNYGTTNVAIQVINTLPILPTINSQVVDELTLLSFNVSATDNDTPSQTVTYALTNSPAGASIDASGLLSWTPTETQGPVTTNITVIVADNGTPPLTTNQTFQVTVNEINVAPVLTPPPDFAFNELTPYSANATATDADSPVNALAFSLISGPSNLTVSASGVINWTPSEAQGPGSYPIQLRVSDTNLPAVNAVSLSTTGSFTLTVNEVNVAPVPTLPPNLTFVELSAYSNNASASDTDLPANSLTFSLISGPSNLTVSASGAIVWTPSEAQGPSTNVIQVRLTDTNLPAVNAVSLSSTSSFTLTITESNTAPVLTLPPNLTFNELTTYSNNATATDADLPTNPLVFSLISGPSNLTVSASGVITWTPSEAQGPSTNVVQVRVTDTNLPAVNAISLSSTGSFTLTVSEINVAPILAAINNFTVNPGQVVSFTAAVTDSDVPTNVLRFNLIGAPSGASVGLNSGSFSWRPSVTQADTTNFIQVRVADTNPPAVNSTSLSHTQGFSVFVNGLAPVLLSNQTYSNGQFRFQVSGSSGPDYVIMAGATPTNFTDLSTNLSATPPFQFSDSAGLSSNRFYRVRLQP